MRSATTPTLPLGLILGLSVLGAISLAAASAAAQSSTGDLVVRAQVAEGCTVSSGLLEFGEFDTNNQLDVAGSFNLDCIAGGTMLISLGPELHPQQRRMTRIGGTETLQYQLFKDLGRTEGWGDTSGNHGTSKQQPVAMGSQVVPVYGRIAAPQPVLPGTYEDTVLITVTPQ